MAYHNNPGEFVLSNGSVGDQIGNFSVHKRAVSSKKIRVNTKKKAPAAKANSGI